MISFPLLVLQHIQIQTHWINVLLNISISHYLPAFHNSFSLTQPSPPAPLSLPSQSRLNYLVPWFIYLCSKQDQQSPSFCFLLSLPHSLSVCCFLSFSFEISPNLFASLSVSLFFHPFQQDFIFSGLSLNTSAFFKQPSSFIHSFLSFPSVYQMFFSVEYG